MIKIDEIKVKGFKNIKSAELKLNNFNVIIGANNSGKSNFIQVISFLNYIINSASDDLEANFKKGFNSTFFNEIIPRQKNSRIIDLLNLEDSSGLIEIELIFSNSNTNRLFTYVLQIKWIDEFFEKHYKINYESLSVKESNKPGVKNNIFNRQHEIVKYGNEFSKMAVIQKVPSHFSVIRLLKIISDINEGYKDAIDSLNEIIKTPIFYFSHIELLKSEKERVNSFNGRVVSFELENEIIKLENNGKWDIYKNALKDILNIEDIGIQKNHEDKSDKMPLNKLLFFIHNDTIKFLNQFSDGTILIIALITKILSNKNPLFLIEEPENSIHPKALVDLIAFIKSYSENTQFIITTHSITLLNKTKMDDIIASSIMEDGFCELYNISSRKDLKNKLKRSKVNFSDELFFSLEDKNEFE
ncbi:MAG: hypothetical protein A2046_02245 [Bacteroidetes bacterium GWA2_30_7]|nr:MAG: hypothetical protein A2046_02245 [Bacteroidetes bacterium GWA2_30_7]